MKLKDYWNKKAAFVKNKICEQKNMIMLYIANKTCFSQLL